MTVSPVLDSPWSVIEVEPEKNVKLIVCGDFNGGDESAAIRFLEDGVIDETFLEDGGPVVSSRKVLPFINPLQDVYADSGIEPPPPTLVVSELISIMVNGGRAYEMPAFTKDVLQRLERVYRRYATHEILQQQPVMNVADVERWLLTINGKVGRGSEFREAAKQMGWKEDLKCGEDEIPEEKSRIALPVDGVLTLAGFIAVYESELRGGKFWGIAHDLAVLGEPLPDPGVFQARYDRIYCSSSVQPTAVMHFSSSAPCPNEQEPSDHLPVAAAFVIPLL